MIKSANISPCQKYRYRLTRIWGTHCYMLPFVMLNPSTADASIDDPTIRRCMRFAQREGASGIIVVNLFAFRATNPDALALTDVPVGPDNATYLDRMALDAVAANMPVVCAWGARAGAMQSVGVSLLRRHGARLVCLGKTAGGHPRHPLYVKGDQPLIPF